MQKPTTPINLGPDPQGNMADTHPTEVAKKCFLPKDEKGFGTWLRNIPMFMNLHVVLWEIPKILTRKPS